MLVADARRETKRERAAFERVRRSERYYALQLRKVARHIQDIVAAFPPDDVQAIQQMRDVLERYAHILEPWSRAVANRMLREVMRRDESAWRSYAKLMGETIEADLTKAPIGQHYQRLMDEQVGLITSLPLDAAKRVHELATGTIYEDVRPAEIAQEILRTGLVTKNRANLIARTEVGRAASVFTQVRAQHIGSEGYIWRTSLDRRVRKLHRKLEGKVIKWDEPPIAGEHGERAHAGAIYACRCWPEPILPSTF